VHEWNLRRLRLHAYTLTHNGQLPPLPRWRRLLACGRDRRYALYGLDVPVQAKLAQRMSPSLARVLT
jgi:hypothetical protein